MKLQEIIETLQLKLLTNPADFSIEPTGGYTSDLLSCVIAGAKAGELWVTLQAHANIVAVAALTDVAAVIITEDAQPDPEVIEKANQQNVTLFSTPLGSYLVCGRLYQMLGKGK